MKQLRTQEHTHATFVLIFRYGAEGEPSLDNFLGEQESLGALSS